METTTLGPPPLHRVHMMPDVDYDPLPRVAFDVGSSNCATTMADGSLAEPVVGANIRRLRNLADWSCEAYVEDRRTNTRGPVFRRGATSHLAGRGTAWFGGNMALRLTAHPLQGCTAFALVVVLWAPPASTLSVFQGHPFGAYRDVGQFNHLAYPPDGAVYEVIGTAYNTRLYNATAVPLNGPRVYVLTGDAASGLRMYSNGTLVANTTFSTGNLGAEYVLGCSGLETAFFFVGEVGEWLVYDQALSAAQVASLTTMLRAKWGV